MRAVLGRIADALLRLVAGGFLIILCMDAVFQFATPHAQLLYRILLPAFFLLFALRTALMWNSVKGVSDVSPAHSGGSVVVATGLMAAYSVGFAAHPLAALLILAFTACGAWLVVRFAQRHADEIGEVRFKTVDRNDASRRG